MAIDDLLNALPCMKDADDTLRSKYVLGVSHLAYQAPMPGSAAPICLDVEEAIADAIIVEDRTSAIVMAVANHYKVSSAFTNSAIQIANQRAREARDALRAKRHAQQIATQNM